MVAPPSPNLQIIRSKHGVDLGSREVADQSLVGSFDRDGQHSCNDAHAHCSSATRRRRTPDTTGRISGSLLSISMYAKREGYGAVCWSVTVYPKRSSTTGS